MRVLKTNFETVAHVAFAPESTHLFATGLHDDGKDAGLDVFDLAGGSEPAKHLFPGRQILWFAPMTAGHLATIRVSTKKAPNESGTYVINWRTGRETRLSVEDWGIGSAGVASADGTHLFFGLRNGPAYLSHGERALHGISRWSLASDGQPRLDWHVGTQVGVNLWTLGTSPDGRSFWSAEWTPHPDWHMELVQRDAATGQPLREPVNYPNNGITFGLSNSFLVAHDWEEPILLVYDLENLDREPRKVTYPVRELYCGGFAFHPSGHWLATVGLENEIPLWDTATWEITRRWVWDAGQTRGIAFSPDGTLAAVGTTTGDIILWDLDL